MASNSKMNKMDNKKSLPIIDYETYRRSQSYNENEIEFEKFIDHIQQEKLVFKGDFRDNGIDDDNVEKSFVHQFLSKYSNQNSIMNILFHSLTYLIEWLLIHQKHHEYLNYYLDSIQSYFENNLILPDLKLSQKQNNRKNDVETFENYLKLYFNFFDLYFRYLRQINDFSVFSSKLPTIQWILDNRKRLIGNHLCGLISQYQHVQIIESIYSMIFTELRMTFISDSECDDHNNCESIHMDALVLVFIKCDGSFNIIARYESKYNYDIFEKFLRLLDDCLLNEKKLLLDYHTKYRINFQQNRTQRMIKRFLNRVHYRWSDHPKFSPLCTPKHIETSNWENLAYLIKLYYRKKAISREAFFELSKRLIDISPVIEQKFIDCLQKSSVNDQQLYYDYLRYNNNLIPMSNLQSYMVDRNFLVDQIQIQSTGCCNVYHDIAYPHDHLNDYRYYYGRKDKNLKIYFICDEQGLRDMLTNHLPYCRNNLLAIDAEWLPIFSYQRQKLSIIQISTYDSCFIIDLVDFHKRSNEFKRLLIDEFYQKFLSNTKYLKIGFGIEQDLDILDYTISNNRDDQAKTTQHLKNIYDLVVPGKCFAEFLSNTVVKNYPKLKSQINRAKIVMRNLQNNNNNNNPNNDHNNSNNSGQYQGLSMLTFILFGRSLNKIERQSDWSRRPLRNEQLLYASLDAYCLIDIFDKLKHISRQFNFNNHYRMMMANDSNNNDGDNNNDVIEFLQQIKRNVE